MGRYDGLPVRPRCCKWCGMPGGIKGMQPLRSVPGGEWEHDIRQGGDGCNWVAQGKAALARVLKRAIEARKSKVQETEPKPQP